MSHELEIVNGVARMAYAGETPWHNLGKKVPSDLLPVQMLEAAGLDWTVRKVPAFADINGEQTAIGYSALVRDGDEAMLDVVSNDWNPVQNIEAFEFFDEYVRAGDMEMHTAGSLKGGQIVWGLAKIKESFELFGGDIVESHLLFTNYHKYGFSTDVRFTPTRVVCNNTLTLALNSNSDRMIKVSHRRAFNPDIVKKTMGIATKKLAKYKEMAQFLGSRQAKSEDIVTYLKRVFPKAGTVKNESEVVRDQIEEMSRNAKTVLDIIPTQPGADFAEGSWWQAFNGVTYFVDHLAARTDEARINSAWYGQGRNLKIKALETAVELANAA